MSGKKRICRSGKQKRRERDTHSLCVPRKRKMNEKMRLGINFAILKILNDFWDSKNIFFLFAPLTRHIHLPHKTILLPLFVIMHAFRMECRIMYNFGREGLGHWHSEPTKKEEMFCSESESYYGKFTFIAWLRNWRNGGREERKKKYLRDEERWEHSEQYD